MSLCGEACMAAINAAPVSPVELEERSAWRMTSSASVNVPLRMRSKIRASTSGLLISMIIVAQFPSSFHTSGCGSELSPLSNAGACRGCSGSLGVALAAAAPRRLVHQPQPARHVRGRGAVRSMDQAQ